jgi:hypothetical protein
MVAVKDRHSPCRCAVWIDLASVETCSIQRHVYRVAVLVTAKLEDVNSFSER